MRKTRWFSLAVRASFGAVALVVLGAHGAHAVTWTTPFVEANAGQRPSCQVTNIGSQPITVNVELVDVAGVTVPPVASGSDEVCPVSPFTLAPRDTCSVLVPDDTGTYCQVVSSRDKVRVALTLFDKNDFRNVLEVAGTK